ncbi:MAG: phosphodiester glycosidase family protein [Christensenella sp.]|nr:phosphodiester glycosidase family protein [Christensenella sp.]
MRKRIWSSIVLLAVICGIFTIQSKSNAAAPQKTGVDFMIICAHPGDESLFLGGVLPLYAGQQGRSAVVVYLSSDSYEQGVAARASLARYGLNVQAVFASFSPVYTSNEEDALRYWDKREVTAYLVNIIRKYQPTIVVSHDPLGEYGHGAHCVASDCALLAVGFAAGENDYPESKDKYGVWQVQRLFLHRYGEKLVTLDRSEPLSNCNGMTALELDQQGYSYYPDQYPILISDDFGYTRAQYGLAYAAQADRFDPSSGDLFAGIAGSPSSVSVRSGPSAAPDVAATPRLFACQSTPAPAETPSPAPEAHSALIPAYAPKTDDFNSYFRAASDPAEVVINDQENEHWEYRSDTLSVIIDREHILRSDNKPISYCVAQIRMRETDSFQAGIHTESIRSIQRLEPPWYMARRYRAVLAITGDNLTRAETELKGILLRNGVIYSANQAQDTLALYPGDLSLKIFKPNTVSPQALLDQGVKNTFSFGPTLLYRYERDLTSKRGHLGRANPRCGLGMVEPGYWIAITVDGRQPKYSVGMTMDGFAQLFYLYGCQLAYNLDGGSSTAMVFMGENLSQHSGEGSDTQRPWTDGLLWGNSELVPTVDDHVYNNGSHPWVPLPDVTPTPVPTAKTTAKPTTTP